MWLRPSGVSSRLAPESRNPSGPRATLSPVDVLNDRLEMVAIDAVVEHPENPRRGDVELIEGLIEENGFFGALIVQRSTGRILVGNHRWKAARRAGADQIPVLFVDVDDERAMKILLSENRANDQATYDEEALFSVLSDYEGNLEGTGYDADALDDLLASIGTPTTPPEEFKGGFATDADLPGPARTSTGDHPMREVVLLIPAPDYPEFMAQLERLKPHLEAATTVQTVTKAVARLDELLAKE